MERETNDGVLASGGNGIFWGGIFCLAVSFFWRHTEYFPPTDICVSVDIICARPMTNAPLDPPLPLLPLLSRVSNYRIEKQDGVRHSWPHILFIFLYKRCTENDICTHHTHTHTHTHTLNGVQCTLYSSVYA